MSRRGRTLSLDVPVAARPRRITLAESLSDADRLVDREARTRPELRRQQRRQMERNAVIKAASDAGVPIKVLARVFRMARSTVQDIVNARQTYKGEQRRDRTAR